VASHKISVRAVRRHGKVMWRVRHWKDGVLKRPLFPSKKEADAKAAALRGALSHAEEIWASMDDTERANLIALYEQKPNGFSPTLSVVIGELLTVKHNAGRSDDYTDTLEWILNDFATGLGSTRVDAIGVAEVEKFLDSKKIESRSTLRARLSTMFKFAVRRGYRADNPCAQLEAVTLIRKPPAVFTVKQFETAVKWLKKNSPECLPWFALSTVCGLRPEEAEKTRKADIHFKEGFVKVEAQSTKVRQRRVVYPKKEALAFLKWAVKKGSLPLDPQIRKRMIAGCPHRTKKGIVRSKGLRHALGFKKAWPKDITRHTAASYWLASDGSAAHVAEMLGHSEKTLKTHYKALVTRSEAEEFWEVVKLIK